MCTAFRRCMPTQVGTGVSATCTPRGTQMHANNYMNRDAHANLQTLPVILECAEKHTNIYMNRDAHANIQTLPVILEHGGKVNPHRPFEASWSVEKPGGMVNLEWGPHASEGKSSPEPYGVQ